MSAPAYDQAFYRELDSSAEVSARVIVPMLLELVEVRSAVDVGCGDGGWLSVLREHGVGDVLGIDGPWIAPELLKIPLEHFVRQSLDQPVVSDRRFDLAMSLEVAEHLPASRAARFVADLTALAPVVLFSAAIPGQGGRHHVNEQWPAYWAALFAERGHAAMDPFRRALWARSDVTWWYRQNLLLFADPSVIDGSARLRELACAAPPLDLVHPECFTRVLRRAEPGLGRWLRMAPEVVRRAVARRRRR